VTVLLDVVVPALCFGAIAHALASSQAGVSASAWRPSERATDRGDVAMVRPTVPARRHDGL